MDRRTFLVGSAALGAAGTSPWSAASAGVSPVRHILPTVSHDAMLVKVSFVEPQQPPKLMLNGTPVSGAATDGEGHCWAFLATGLAPSRDYKLGLSDSRDSLVQRNCPAGSHSDNQALQRRNPHWPSPARHFIPARGQTRDGLSTIPGL
jgi:hypothetical protein